MRLTTAVFTLFFGLLAAWLPAQEASLEVMSFNIRFPNPDDGFHYWEHRKDIAAGMIRFYEADIVGLQEAFRSQLDDLTERLPEYEWFGVCRTDGATAPDPDNEFSALLYRSDRLERLEGGTFWLSSTPDQAGSKGWDAMLPRIVTWAQFRDLQTKKTFFFFNTHFSHVGRWAREESARLLTDRIAKIAGDAPVVVTGDFNCNEASQPYRLLTMPTNESPLYDALYESETPHHGPRSTGTNGFKFPGMGDRIDFIFIKNGVRVLKHGILSDSWSGRLPSDHLPVLARVVIP